MRTSTVHPGLARLLLFLLVLALGAPGFSAPVGEPAARELARRFLAAHGLSGSAPELLREVGDPGQVHYRVYGGAEGGFVIVAGDDLVLPVWGYSTTGSFPAGDLPSNVAKWFEGYRAEMRAVLANGAPAHTEVARAWEKWSAAEAGSEAASRAVPPLMQTIWNQSPHVNAQCPGGSVTGCVATAMAQIMKFHNHPAQGAGFHSYNAPNYGTLSANFGATTYNWGAMPNAVNSANNAVATLMYHVGVSVDMQYSPQVSGAWVIQAHSPSTDHNSEYALKTYFNYHSSMQGLKRENYGETQWINMLKADLDLSRPVLYAGWGSGGGHAFVCDGYDNNNFFHFNWGWGGNYNGNFTVNALNPDGVGTGGGTGSYNSGQQALFGIRPATGGGGGGGGQSTFNLGLYAPVSPSAWTIGYGQGFSVNTNIVNLGTNNFSGDYCAAVFDANSVFYGYVQTLSNYSLQPGYVYNNNLVFSTPGLFSMLPGTYYVGIFYRPSGGEWVLVNNNGGYTNLPQVTVVNANAIELNANLSVSPGTTVAQGANISVNTNVLNTGASTFFGQYGVGLFNLDGSWAQDIGVLTESQGLPNGYTYLAPYLTFGPVPVTVPPGTYLLATQHNPGNGWQLTGSTYHANPVFITVVAPSLQPDVYEANNTAAQAHGLSVNFSGNNAVVNTTGSNLHSPTDQDFYQVTLPAGYSYSITARLHDAYNSGNGNSYSVDGMFSWSNNGGAWSAVYDDVMPGPFTVTGPATVKFHVAPYFTGETGTYLLQLNIQRTAGGVGVEEQALSGIRVYPNPANDRLNVDLSELNGQLEALELFDVNGRTVPGMELSGTTGTLRTLHIGDVAPGAYMLRMATSVGVRTERVLIAR